MSDKTITTTDGDKVLLFWGGEFSNWHKIDIVHNEYPKVIFKSTAHYIEFFKAMLFQDLDIAGEIIEEESVYQVRKLGSKIKDFDGFVWGLFRYQIAFAANMKKFTLDDKLRMKLIQTKDIVMAEAMREDFIWGIGYDAINAPMDSDKWGLNLTGQVLMEVRKILNPMTFIPF